MPNLIKFIERLFRILTNIELKRMPEIITLNYKAFIIMQNAKINKEDFSGSTYKEVRDFHKQCESKLCLELGEAICCGCPTVTKIMSKEKCKFGEPIN